MQPLEAEKSLKSAKFGHFQALRPLPNWPFPAFFGISREDSTFVIGPWQPFVARGAGVL
jgi:hypothetical protein